jgi:hypothetical protein
MLVTRRLLATVTTAAVFAIAAFGAAPVAAVTGGDLTASAPTSVVDRGGTISLRLKYNCIQYDEPYNGSDVIYAVITASGRGYASSFTNVVCDGMDRRVTLSLDAIYGRVSGPANLQIGHEGLTPDGLTATLGVWVNVPITVVIAGPK